MVDKTLKNKLKISNRNTYWGETVPEESSIWNKKNNRETKKKTFAQWMKESQWQNRARHPSSGNVEWLIRLVPYFSLCVCVVLFFYVSRCGGANKRARNSFYLLFSHVATVFAQRIVVTASHKQNAQERIMCCLWTAIHHLCRGFVVFAFAFYSVRKCIRYKAKPYWILSANAKLTHSISSLFFRSSLNLNPQSSILTWEMVPFYDFFKKKENIYNRRLVFNQTIRFHYIPPEQRLEPSLTVKYSN